MPQRLFTSNSYGLDLFLLSVDEGIRGYRDDSLETVKRNKTYYKIPLKVDKKCWNFNNL
jgi:tRNA(Ile)-lysidine synthase TilS/MesJ